MRGDAGNVDNAALAALAHGRAKFLAGQQQPADEVQIKHLRPSGQGDVFKRHLRRDGGIGIIAAGSIEQYRRCAERLGHCLVAGLETVRIHGVAGEKLRGSAGFGDFLNACLTAFGAPAHHGNFRPSLSHCHGTSPAEGAGGADHHSYFIG